MDGYTTNSITLTHKLDVLLNIPTNILGNRCHSKHITSKSGVLLFPIPAPWLSCRMGTRIWRRPWWVARPPSPRLWISSKHWPRKAARCKETSWGVPWRSLWYKTSQKNPSTIKQQIQNIQFISVSIKSNNQTTNQKTISFCLPTEHKFTFRKASMVCSAAIVVAKFPLLRLWVKLVALDVCFLRFFLPWKNAMKIWIKRQNKCHVMI